MIRIILPRRLRANGAKVRRPRQRLPPALFIQNLLGRRDVHLLRRRRAHLPRIVRVVKHQAGVDAAAPRRARQSRERRQPHGRVERFAVFDHAG